MSEPTDFEPIAASLRRQFSPPDLEHAIARVVAAASDAERVIVAPSVDEPAPKSSRRRGVAGLVVAFAAAAALVLALGPWRPDVESRTQAESSNDPTTVALAPSPAQLAGRQLADFLKHGNTLPGDPGSCSVEQAPPDCRGAEDGPRLRSTPNALLMGECGGTTGVDCASHDLPAQRAMLVRLMPSGTHVILCIEPPWADPHPRLPDDSEYEIFRRSVGGYVLYEVTPLDQPRAMDYLEP